MTVVITWSYFSWWLLPCTPTVEAAAEAAERRGRRSSGLASSPSPSNDLTCLCCHSSFHHTPPSCDWPRIEKGGRSLVNAFPRQIQICYANSFQTSSLKGRVSWACFYYHRNMLRENLEVKTQRATKSGWRKLGTHSRPSTQRCHQTCARPVCG